MARYLKTVGCPVVKYCMLPIFPCWTCDKEASIFAHPYFVKNHLICVLLDILIWLVLFLCSKDHSVPFLSG